MAFFVSSFKADKQIFIKGVNIFSIKCGLNAQFVDQRRFSAAIQLQEGENGDRARKVLTRDGTLEPEYETSSGSRYFPVLFDKEVRIPANVTFGVSAVVSVSIQ